MKINLISIKRFLALVDLYIPINKPVVIIAGNNESGKSSTLDAIELATTGELPRVSQKKQSPLLINNNAGEKEFSEITIDADGEERTTILRRSGMVKSSGADLQNKYPSLPYVLKAQRFSSLPEKEKKTFLMGLLKVSLKPADIKAKLIANGHDEKFLNDRIMPMIKLGFDAAHKDAQDALRDAKRDWETLTGEKYGSVKSASWSIDADEATLGPLKLHLTTLSSEAEKLTEEIGELNKKIGAAQATNAQVKSAHEMLEKEPALIKEHDLIKKSADLLQKEVDELASKSDSTHGATKVECPCCNEVLYIKGDVLFKPVSSKELTDEERQALVEAKSKLLSNQTVLANLQKQLDAIANAKSASTQEPIEIDPLNDLLLEKQENLKSIQLKIDEKRAEILEIEGAAAKNEKAKQLLATATALSKIVDDLAPSGLPSKILSEALSPINERLALSGKATKWGVVIINNDMSITADGIPYSLLSVSRQWRTDALIAEAISHISGVKLLVLDGFDVLQLSARSELIGWLNNLGKAGQIDTAIICGTLKEAIQPSILPSYCQAHWISDGMSGTRPDSEESTVVKTEEDEDVLL